LQPNLSLKVPTWIDISHVTKLNLQKLQILMGEGFGVGAAVGSRNIAIAHHLIFLGDKTLPPHWPTGRHLLGANTHLSPDAIVEVIDETGRLDKPLGTWLNP
jgi:hypothetical protein